MANVRIPKTYIDQEAAPQLAEGAWDEDQGPVGKVVSEPVPTPGVESGTGPAATRSQVPHKDDDAAVGEELGSSLLGRYLSGHERAFMGGVIGLLAAALVFLIGPLRTVVVALFVGVGVAVGEYLDGDPKIVSVVRRLLGGPDHT